MWNSWSRSWIASVLLTASAAYASNTTHRLPIAPSRPRPVEPDWIETVDRYHDAASSYVVAFGEGMDGWLARRFQTPENRLKRQRPNLLYDPQQLMDAKGSRVVVSPALELQEADGASFGLRIKGRLMLPRFSDRLELVFDSDDDLTDVAPDLPLPREIGLRPSDEGSASLRYRLSDDLKFKPSLEAGLKFKPEPVPRLGLRLRLNTRRTWITTRLTQTFFWESQEGWGERTIFDLERARRDRYLCRLSSSVLWTENSDGLQGGQTFQYFRYLSGRRAIGLKLGAFGPLEPSAYVETYSAHLVWRRRVHRQWLFLELEPGIDWPRDRNFDATAIFRVKLDIIIGDWFENENGNGK